MIILAFPPEPFVVTVIADENVVAEDKRQLAKENCLRGELMSVISSLKIRFAVTDIMVCGPWDYVTGLSDEIVDYFNDPSLFVMPVPAGEKLKDPFVTTESGLILNV